MLINKIKLRNYRNYSNKEIEFDKHLNIIIGKNGIGKTNILESIIFISNTKSYRTNIDQNLIKHDKDYSTVEITTNENIFKAVINNKTKSLYVDDLLIKKTSDFIGKLNAILFEPSNLELFNLSPSDRRKLLDIEISKVSNLYIKTILKYNSLIKDKNKLLKEIEIDEILLNLINESLIPLIEIIVDEREIFFEIINHNINQIYKDIANDDKNIKIIYKKCSEKEDIKNKLEETKEKDKFYHYSIYGPHHDDYSFMIDDKNINDIASQGQKRMIMIAFKFSLIDYIYKKTNKYPILLLDDILSELDENNKNRLIKNIPKDIQTIITNTDLKGIVINEDYKLIEIKEEDNV